MKRSCCLIAVLAGLIGGTAAVEAETEPAPCAVRFVRAPAGMAPVIAARLEALAACTMPLDVWIVRSDEGLYLVARDGLGRMRERMVPDVEVAAALIASWVEPGAFEHEAPDVTPAPDAAAITAEPTATPSAAVVSAAPGTVSPRPELDDEPLPSWDRDPERDPATPATPAGNARTFAIGGQVGVTWDNETTRGMHFELELMRRGGAFFSFDAQLVQELGDTYYVVDAPVTMMHFEEIGRTGLDTLLRAGYHVGRRIYFRPSLAAGLGGSRHEILRTEPSPFNFPMAGTYTDWSYGVRIGFAATLGVQFETVAIEMSVLELASLQEEKPGVSGDDRMISAGLGLRFRR